MNKTLFKSYTITLLEPTSNYIVLNYCLPDTICFTNAEDNFIRVTSMQDIRLIAPNLFAQLNQCHEKNASTSTVRRSLCEAGLYDRIAVKEAKTMSKGSSRSRRTKTGQ